MSLYITTSRKPSKLTRQLAKWLEALLGGECENRGKRSIAEALERAASKGFFHLLIIHESHGNPSKLAFLRRKQWLPEIVLSSAVIPKKEKQRFPKEFVVAAQGETGRKIKELLQPEEKEVEEEAVIVHASEKEISFSYKGKRVGPVLKISSIRG